MRDSFIFHRSFKDAVGHLSDEQKLKCYEGFFEYAMDGALPTDAVALALVKALAPVMDKVNKNYEKKVEAGKKGGEVKARRGTDAAGSSMDVADSSTGVADSSTGVADSSTGVAHSSTDVAQPYLKEKDKEKEKEKDNDKGSSSGGTTTGATTTTTTTSIERIPSLEDVKAYCVERENAVNPQAFYDYYAANGWKLGRNPMKDWRAAVRRWEATEPKQKRRGLNNFRPRPSINADREAIAEARMQELVDKARARGVDV